MASSKLPAPPSESSQRPVQRSPEGAGKRGKVPEERHIEDHVLVQEDINLLAEVGRQVVLERLLVVPPPVVVPDVLVEHSHAVLHVRRQPEGAHRRRHRIDLGLVLAGLGGHGPGGRPA